MDRTALLATTGLTTASTFQTNFFVALQEQIASRVAGRDARSIAVEAVAGSGKTTTIVAGAKLIPSDWVAVFLAFNKAIADELNDRLPRHVEGKTLNALGHRMVAGYFKSLGVSKLDIKKNRTNLIMRNLLTFKQSDDFGADVAWLVGMCKSMGVAPVGANDAVGIDDQRATDDVLNSICCHHGRMIDPTVRNTVFRFVREVLAISFSDDDVLNTRVIDYDDQKWMTVCKRPNGRAIARPIYDIVMVDEVQDVNSVDIEMVRMVLKPNGIVIGVGDTNQAIYGFRGADTEAFQNFTTSFNAVKMPLSITYRCGRVLVQHAQELVPSIQPAPKAAEGKVERLVNYKPTDFQGGDLVMCRNNAPLIEFAYKLIRARVPVIVKGRNIGEGLVRVINDLMGEAVWVTNPKTGRKMKIKEVPTNAKVTVLAERLSGWLDNQIAMIRAENPDDEAAVERVFDQVDSIRVFMEANSDGLVTSVVEDINALFSDNGKDGHAVVASSIHKAKGLEADRAFMYRPDKLYPAWVAPGTWQYKQEVNLDYVARTRGKTFYGYLEADCWAE